MNRAFRIVFNRALGVWQVVSEIASSPGKGTGARGGLRLFMLLPLAAWASLGWAATAPPVDAMHANSGGTVNAGRASTVPVTPLFAHQLPTNGTVSAGSGSIAQNGAAMTITQNTQNLAINWQSFDIGENASVTFLQPNATAIALNRVLGSNTTHILGKLTGNGQVWVLNPNGVLFGNTAQVNVGGLVASTLGLSDADFMAGKRSFTGSGGSVVNQGSLNGGYVALLGETVRNEGAITARLGTAALAAGNRVTLDFNGDALLNVQVDEGALHALADNRGLIQADGGSVLMTARARDALLDTAVNNTGIIRARTVENRNGRILLLGDMHSGTANIAGMLDASAPDGGNGGLIETSAAHVNVTDNAIITTKAAIGQSGTWLIDPNDFTIAASGGNMTGAAVGNALDNNGNFIIQTATMGTAGGNGDIHVNDAVNWSSNSTLTLQAERSVNVNAAITATGTNAGLVVDYNQGSGITDGNFYANARVNLPLTGSLAINGQAYTLIDSLAGLGSQTGHYALVNDITTPINVPRGTLSGTFEGLGHTLSNLDVTTVQPTVGLFGNITGTVRNLTLAGRVIGTGSTVYVGMLTGFNDGTIVNVRANGRVDGYHFNGYVGGLVGTNTGTILGSSANVTVTSNGGRVGGLVGYMQAGSIGNSYANGSVNGGYDVGGLVGYMENSSIDHSYATGAVSSGNEGASIGGLVGHSHNHADISHAYATGNVTHHGPNGLAGGLVGFMQSYTTLDNVWASGTVSGSYYNGGLAGHADSNTNTATAAYWNTESTGQANALGAGSFGSATNVSGLTTAQMADKSYWTGFTFNSTPGGNGWVWLSGVLPMLTSEWSAYIRNAHQLQLMMLDLSADYTLGNDIDASATNGKDVWLGSSFASVGNIAIAFTGQLDGQGHAIDGLHVLRGSNNYTGLFGFIGNATLKDFNLTNATIEGQNYVGALAGYAMGSHINNVTVSGAVTGNQYVGGMVGYGAEVQIDNTSSAGTVSGDIAVGGLVGQVAGTSTLSDSYAEGDISASIGNAGGLVGQASSATISGSHATGNVTANNNVGGLVGSIDANADVTNSYATGDVNGVGQNTGGLVGLASAGIISNSHATGNVAGGDYVGGLLGRGDAAISNSYAQGTVTANGATGYVGGLAGYTSAAISGSHATGNVTYTGIGDYVGGLAGRANAAITSSYASGDVSGVSSVGGLAGGASGSNVSHSYASGNVTGSGNYVGGLLGLATNGSTIGNSYATGNVTGSGSNVGGLLGIAANGSTVSNSYATGNATGDFFVGGLVGFTNQSSINNSYASGNVRANSQAAGGLVGRNGSTNISNSYATGSVSAGGSTAGGLVGKNDVTASGVYSDISNSYATGAVTGGVLSTGGLVGDNRLADVQGGGLAGTITGSFWNTETTGQTGSADGGGTGVTTAQMQQLSTFVDAGWDISDQGGDGKVWRIYEGSTAPLLRSFMQQLTVTAPAGGTDKTYDGHIASGSLGSYTTSAPADASQLLGALGYATTGANAGTYSTANGTLQLSGLYSTQQGYDISYAGNSSLTINKAALTVTANNASKTYDATAWSGGNGVSYSGFVNGENEAVLGGTLAYGGNSQGAVNAGNYLISASGLSSGNYAISYVDGTLTIDPRTLGIVVNLTGTVRKTYDGTTNATLDAGNFLITGWAGNDSATITQTSGQYDNANAGSGKNVTVNLTLADYLAANGTDLANYVLPTQVSGNVGIIDKADATVTANSGTVTYNGQVRNVTGYTVTGLVNGEDESVLDSVVTTGGSGRNAGSYAHTVSGSDNNYNLTFVDGALTIDKASLVIGTSDVTKTYDGTLGAAGNAIVLGGQLFGTDSLDGGSFAYTDKNVGTGKTVTVNGVTIDDSNGGNNYAITYADNNTSTILQKVLTVSGGFDAEDKLYDGSDSASISRNALALDGVVAGDALTANWQAAFNDPAIGVNKAVTLQGSALAGSDSGNYLLDLSGAPTTVASILGTPIGTDGTRYDGATRSAKSAQQDERHKSHASSPMPEIAVLQCGQNLPAQLTKDCR